MALVLGTRIGVFEVTGALGSGGMGDVYRAKDTKLGWEVALKILPEQFATDTRRLVRFCAQRSF
jgi:serine/threonine protein kinase